MWVLRVLASMIFEPLYDIFFHTSPTFFLLQSLVAQKGTLF